MGWILEMLWKKGRCGGALACGAQSLAIVSWGLCSSWSSSVFSLPQRTDPGLYKYGVLLHPAESVPLAWVSLRSSSHPCQGLGSTLDCLLPP